MHNDDRMNAVLERKSAIRREDGDDSRSRDITDRREKLRGIRGNTDTTDISEPEMKTDVSEENEDMVVSVCRKESQPAKWLTNRISAIAERQYGEEDKSLAKEDGKPSKKDKRELKEIREDLMGMLAENVMDSKGKNGTILAELFRRSRVLALAEDILYIYNKKTGCYVPS